MDWVAALHWIGWQLCTGLGGRNHRNTHVDDAFRQIVSNSRRDEVRQRYRLPARFLLYAGAIYPPKNFTRLIHAYAKVGPELGIPLVVAGGENRFLSNRELEIPDRLGLQQWVLWLGWIDPDTLPAVYQMAEALLLPSLFESFGLPIVEAMACNCPVLTSDRYGMKEIAQDAAVLVNPEDIDSIAEGIRRIIQDGKLRAFLIAQGRRRSADFRWPHCAAQTLRVIESIGKLK